MIAETYPLKRLPRRFGVFDYLIPEGMRLKRGMFVRIPFRATTVWGVVSNVKNAGSNRALKTVESVATDLILSTAELDFYEAMAKDLVQSPSTILYSSIPGLPKTYTVAGRARTASPSDETLSAFLLSPNLQTSVSMIQSFCKTHGGTTLVIAPNVRDAQLLAAHLNASVMTGDETQAQRRAVWESWRLNGGTLVATRIGILLPHPDLRTIFIVRSSHPNHKQADRNPRFDSRQAARLRAKFQHARLYFLDASPRADELHHIDETATPVPVGPYTIVDMNKERSAGVHPLLSPTFSDAAESALNAGKRVLCIYNRKGVSKRMRCQDCGFVFVCSNCRLPLSVHDDGMQCHHCGLTQALPAACPSCHGHDLLRRGFGNKKVAEALKNCFPGRSVAIVEKGANDGVAADILLATRFYLEDLFDPFAPGNIGLVADLDADMALHQPNFRATEHAILSANEWRGVASAHRAPFILQTDTPEVFQRGLEDPIAFMKSELKTRADYDLPPVMRVMTTTKRSDGSSERFVGEEPPAVFRELPDSDIIDTWADS
jgi:primosomal protein N'